MVADLRDVFPSESRWSDRFTAAGRGLDGTFRSDFHVARVERPFAAITAVEGERIARPEFVGGKGVHHAQASGIRFDRPATDWLHLDDATVQDGGTVLADGALIVYEESADPRLDFVAGQWETVYGSSQHPEAALVRLKEPAADLIDEGILIAGRSDSNWYHWLIEYLPRVTMIEPTVDQAVPLLITARTPASGLAALRAITDRPLVTIDPSALQRVRRLHVAAPPVQILDTTRVPWADGVRLNPEPLRALRSAWGLTDAPVVDGRRVFLSRKSAHRGLLNEAELVETATAAGLEVVEPGTMTFEDQLELFSNASLVVGASGAVMANYLMMSRGSRVIALTSEALTDFILPAVIAAVAGVDFTYVSGPTSRSLADSGTRNNWIHSDFSVPRDVLAAALGEG
jgi:capsular polysaccharide biosynthesis protein